MSFHKVLAALDDSSLSRVVFNQAVELAQIYRGALKLFHCVNSDLLNAPMMSNRIEPGLDPGLTMGNYQTQHILIEQQIEQAKNLLENYARLARDRQVIAEWEYKVGPVGDSCCEAAASWGADLLVIGRRGHSGLTEALLGSVSNYVLHHAPCAVLVLQPEA